MPTTDGVSGINLQNIIVIKKEGVFVTLFLQILLGISIAVVLLGHFVCALIDRAWVYPKRLGKVQPDIPRLDPIDLPPDDLPPALASRLYFFGQQKRKGLSYTQFAVTLLDLVHRKKILVDHSTNHLYFTPLDDGEGLLPFEQTLLNFIVAATSESGPPKAVRRISRSPS